MFFDANQAEQALAQHQQGQQRQPDPLREVVEVAAAFMLGRSVAKLFQKQAADATHRCW